MEILEELKQDKILKTSALDREKIFNIFSSLYEKYADEQLAVMDNSQSFASAVASSLSAKHKSMNLNDFNELSALFAAYGTRNDILFYDANCNLANSTSNRIGVLGLYSIGVHGDILYDHPFNILYNNKPSDRPMHSAFVFDDYVFDFVLGVNGVHICKYIANIFSVNPGMRISIWSSCKSPVASFLNDRSVSHDGINKISFKRLCDSVSDKYFSECCEDLYFSNTSYGTTNPDKVMPLVENSQLSVQPKPKTVKKSKKIEKKSEDKQSDKPKTAKKKTGGSSGGSNASTSGTKKVKKKTTKSSDDIDGIPREADISRRSQKAMIEDIRKQLAAAISLCEN